MNGKLQQTIQEAIEARSEMDACIQNIEGVMRQITALVRNHHKAVRAVRDTDSTLPERSAIAKVERLEVRFEEEYLQLQMVMQRENTTYTAVSNVLKTRHDTVKNSIGNIR